MTRINVLMNKEKRQHTLPLKYTEELRNNKKLGLPFSDRKDIDRRRNQLLTLNPNLTKPKAIEEEDL